MSDLAAGIKHLADAFVKVAKVPTTNAPNHSIIWAVVTATTTATPNTISIQILGDSTVLTGIKYDASYTAAVGNTVYGFKYGNDIVIQGKLSGT